MRIKKLKEVSEKNPPNDLQCLKNIVARYERLEVERVAIVKQSIELEEQESKIVETQNMLEEVIDTLSKIEFPTYTPNSPCDFDITRIKKLLGDKNEVSED